MPCCYRYPFFFFFPFLFGALCALVPVCTCLPLTVFILRVKPAPTPCEARSTLRARVFLFLDDTISSSSCLVTDSRPADPRPTRHHHHHRDLILLFGHGGRRRNGLERPKRGETQSVPGLKSKIERVRAKPEAFISRYLFVLHSLSFMGAAGYCTFFSHPIPPFFPCIFLGAPWLFARGSKCFDHLTRFQGQSSLAFSEKHIQAVFIANHSFSSLLFSLNARSSLPADSDGKKPNPASSLLLSPTPCS